MKYVMLIMMLCLSSSAQAEILFQDPTRDAVSEAFDQLYMSGADVTDISPPEVGRKQYMLGLLYLNGSRRFPVDKNCPKAVEMLTASWQAGIADAGHVLAAMYYHGSCVEEDIDRARELATRTAEAGYIQAQRMLGLAYVGWKWEKLYPYDVDKGIHWLSKAGNAGDRQAAGRLAGMYNRGQGVSKDDKKYYMWLKKAVFNKFEKSNSTGFSALAEIYENGRGTKKDFVKAYKYYDLSGTASIEDKQRVAQKMTQAQIDEARRQSQAWQEEHNIRIGGGFIRRVE